MRLSPLTRSNMLLTALIAGQESPVRPTTRRNKAVEVEAYKCSVCDALHECEFEAEDCCPYDGDANDNLLLDDQEGDAKCPVCGTGYADTYLAANCCLWKDLPPAARWRIAAAVDGGALWSDAIARETDS